jgi:crotonobetainyl-CoA:carnitine CoA-transferase CaiB-like acyl-CoA transferase
VDRTPLEDFRIVDLSDGIAGGYCTKLYADGGADVVIVEAPAGHPLRRFSETGCVVRDGDDSVAFQYLAASKRSVVVDPADAGSHDRVIALIRDADAVVWSPAHPVARALALDPDAIAAAAPHVTILSITPFGRATSWTGRSANQFTLQALSGSVGHRGAPDRAPVVAGGQLGDWLTGMVAAVNLEMSRLRTAGSGVGEIVDLSALEAIISTTTLYSGTTKRMLGSSDYPHRGKNMPDVERTSDGYVGLMTVTGQQWLDFCVLVDQPQWMDDDALISMFNRRARRNEIGPLIADWMGRHTTAEVLELARALRVPAAPIGDGSRLPQLDQFRALEMYVTNPSGSFVQPRRPHEFHTDLSLRPLGPAPQAGEHSGQPWPAPGRRRTSAPEVSGGIDPHPLKGLRVADFTAFWAGPLATQFAAHLGADVIHVESAIRPDGMRLLSGRRLADVPDDPWWEWSPIYQGPNTNKRDLTLDMQSARGRELALQLIKTCDVVVENYTPRVFDSWGLTYEAIKAVRPDIIMMRMPAFGLTGPWKDLPGFAHTQEQVSGLAFVTGYPDDGPQIPNGPCDAIAGHHGAWALLQAIEHRRRTGEGVHVELPMVATALQLTATQVGEFSKNGRLIERIGNRGVVAVPQGLYPAGDLDPYGDTAFVAISVEGDEQWDALSRVIDFASCPHQGEFGDAEGRRRHHDELDEAIAAWTAKGGAAEAVGTLQAAGIASAIVVRETEQGTLPPIIERGYYEEFDHPLVGRNVYSGPASRFSGGPERFTYRAAPTLGEHNREVLREIGLGDDEIDQLEKDGVIGTTAG